jgi:8-oxo-dGTP pyrophosphatase MutT (NUDIX family)
LALPSPAASAILGGVTVAPRDAASVILLRPRAGQAGFEVFLLRRRRGASFLASAYVFPGGGTDPGEAATTSAARELFEEAGVLLAQHAATPTAPTAPVAVPELEALRTRVLGGEPATAVLAAAGLAWHTAGMVPWSRWITPSAEPRRFDARFFVATLPEGQVPRFDAKETVDQAWVSPAEGLARAGELALPPPQVRTLWELARLATVADVFAVAHARATELHPILPRMAPTPGRGAGFALLLPWDPEYQTAGTGDGAPLPDPARTPRWADGPSRFYLEDRAWSHVGAPGSTTAG